jgi:dihydrolipoamide dehydrogenase
MESKFHLVVIGSGPGGYVAAIRAAQLGFQTAIVERAEWGGICLNWGCIPTKALLHCAHLFQKMKEAKDFGVLTSEVCIDFPRMVQHSRRVAARLSKGIEYLFRKNKITPLTGMARILPDKKVEVALVDGQKTILEADHILVATGARSRNLPGVAFDPERVITSKEALVLKELPRSMVIIGAGAIGVEFAYLFASLGVRVSLLEMMPQILPAEDREVVDLVSKSFKKLGIEILTECKVNGMEKSEAGVKIAAACPDGPKEISADIAIVSVGVQGNVEDLGLDAAGVRVEKNFIPVNRTNYQTNVPGIYAIGDVIGPPWLAHVASAEGIVAVEAMAEMQPKPIDYNYIPACTYCQPEISRIGYTEDQAKALNFQVKVGRFPFRANGKSIAMGQEEGFAKLIFDQKTEELLGAHVVGADAAALVGELAVAKSLQTTGEELFSTIHAHPTLSEVIQEAAEDAFGRAIHI